MATTHRIITESSTFKWPWATSSAFVVLRGGDAGLDAPAGQPRGGRGGDTTICVRGTEYRAKGGQTSAEYAGHIEIVHIASLQEGLCIDIRIGAGGTSANTGRPIASNGSVRFVPIGKQ